MVKRVHKKRISILLVIIISLIYISINKTEAYAERDNNYLVLVRQKNGSWKEYTNYIEVSDNGYLMIKAKRISKALDFSYKKNSDGTFVIKKNAANYNKYTRNTKEFKSVEGDSNLLLTAVDKAYTSKLSNYNLCTVSSLETLVNYKCFNSTSAKEYAGFDGVVCFSKDKDIPESVPIIDIKPTAKPTPIPQPELSQINIEGVEFPVRDGFLTKTKALSDWGGTATLWSKLEQELDGTIVQSTNLWYDSKRIEFSHQGVGCDGVSLSKAGKGYELSISVKLEGSVTSNQNASILKAMVATISSKPILVYEAIYDSFTSTKTHGINEATYVAIGDCKLKVKVKDGIVTYYIKENN